MKKEVLYPDDLEGKELAVDPKGRYMEQGDPVLFWDASDAEDAKVLPDGAVYGWWCPVEVLGDHADLGYVWMSSPRTLREAMARMEVGTAFEVLNVDLGEGENNPHQVDVAVITG